MRFPRHFAPILIAAAATLASPLAHAAMFKCTAPDGTVAFQAAPCQTGAKQENADVRPISVGTDARSSTSAGRSGAASGIADGSGRVQVAQDSQLRAVADREETQRRDRCRSYRDAIDRQSAALSSASEGARQKAAREINTQEQKAKADHC